MKENQPTLSKGKKSPGNNRAWLILAVLLVIASGIYFFRPSADITSANSNLPETQSPAVSAVAAPPEKLNGKWQRTDGGYVLELKSPAKEGLIEAAYFNPNPIHVGKSAWQQNEGMLKVMVELQDKNYPGSLYTLIYYPDNDQLRGTYFQAIERVNYDVAFTRIP